MSNKNVTARDMLKTSQQETEHKLTVTENGEQKNIVIADIYGSHLIEHGKLNKTTAYEIRMGKGFARKGERRLPVMIKVNVVTLNEAEQEINREVGYTYNAFNSVLYNLNELDQKEEKRETLTDQALERARAWVSKEREKLIRQANINLIKENRKKLKEAK